MLNERDIDYMKRADADIRINRQLPILIHWTTKLSEDVIPWTGEPTEISETDVPATVNAVVTEVTTEEHALQSGIEVENGDIIVDIRFDEMPVEAGKVEKVTYADKQYTIIGADRRGIGTFIRVEMVGRLHNG